MSSDFAPFLPISLHVFKTSSCNVKGSLPHFSFFLTKAISSSPKGEPCEEAFPDLFGDPNPIIVLQDIKVGLFAFEAFDIAFDICFSLCPLTSRKVQP